MTADPPGPRRAASRAEAGRIAAEHRTRLARERPDLWRRQRSDARFALIFLAALFLVVSYVTLDYVLDSVGQQWTRCVVYSASPRAGGRGGPYVQISTSCGKLAFDRGVTRSNGPDIARKFTPNTVYEFKLGRISRLPWISFADITAHDWRTV